MNIQTFLKVAGKKMTLSTDGVYEFTGVAYACMSHVDAWHELNAAVVSERDGYRFHIVYANNGTYFKYDGPGSEYRCINFFVESIKEGECWLESCIIGWTAKDRKDAIRRYRNFALSAPISEIEEGRQGEKSGYTWRYFKNVGEDVLSIKEIKEAEEKATEKVA